MLAFIGAGLLGLIVRRIFLARLIALSVLGGSFVILPRLGGTVGIRRPFFLSRLIRGIVSAAGPFVFLFIVSAIGIVGLFLILLSGLRASVLVAFGLVLIRLTFLAFFPRVRLLRLRLVFVSLALIRFGRLAILLALLPVGLLISVALILVFLAFWTGAVRVLLGLLSKLLLQLLLDFVELFFLGWLLIRRLLLLRRLLFGGFLFRGFLLARPLFSGLLLGGFLFGWFLFSRFFLGRILLFGLLLLPGLILLFELLILFGLLFLFFLSSVSKFLNRFPGSGSRLSSRCSSCYPCTAPQGRHLLTHPVIARKRAHPISKAGRFQPQCGGGRAPFQNHLGQLPFLFF